MKIIINEIIIHNIYIETYDTLSTTINLITA